MPGMSEAYLNPIVDHGATNVTYVSLADAPFEADELAVTRQAITWSVASDGDITATNEPTFDVDGGSTVNHVQYWSSDTAGTFYGASAVTEETFGGNGTYTVTAADINHNVAV